MGDSFLNLDDPPSQLDIIKGYAMYPSSRSEAYFWIADYNMVNDFNFRRGDHGRPAYNAMRVNNVPAPRDMADQRGETGF
jgi:hypothetical protein